MITGEQLQAMTSMEFVEACEDLPMVTKLQVAIARIDYKKSDYELLASILNDPKLKELKVSSK